jgi:hypothetical protein
LRSGSISKPTARRSAAPRRAPDGSEIAIKNGKIEGDKISFLVSIDFGGMALDLNYTGVVKPDQIAFTLDVMGMPFEFAVKKAAK